ncbi:MAB_1171c family putative transporter [Catellatospora citrea]|uniref:MAB_1171c family putative transporter n=1 Tax=Catellatospora citrea TaxID=53366 RepID=UPI0033FCA925
MIPWLTSGAFLLAAVVVGAVLARRPQARTPAGKALLTWNLFGAVAQIVTIHPVYHAVGSLVGHHNTAIVISHGLGLVAAFFAEIMMLCWTRDAGGARAAARSRAAVTGGAIAALAVLFALTPEVADTPSSWRLDNIERPTVALYSVVYALAYSWVLLDLCRLSVRYARMVVTPQTRIGLRLFTVGTAFGLAYQLMAAVDGLVGVTGHRLPAHTPLSLALVCVGVVFLCLGAVVPLVTTAVIEFARRCRQAWLCHRMEPLYRDLATEYPQVLKGPVWYGTTGWLVNWYGNGRRLMQRTIEIHDGLSELRPWMDDLAYRVGATEAMKEGFDAEAVALVAQSVQVADALRTRRGGAPGHRIHVEMVEVAKDHEAVWLARLAQTYRTRLVGHTLDALASRRDPAGRQAVRNPS